MRLSRSVKGARLCKSNGAFLFKKIDKVNHKVSDRRKFLMDKRNRKKYNKN